MSNIHIEDIYNRLEDLATMIEEDRNAQKVFREKLLTAFLSLKKDVDQEKEETHTNNKWVVFETNARVTMNMISMALNGRKIEAIKELRTQSGMGLKDAKDLIESWIDKMIKDVSVNYERQKAFAESQAKVQAEIQSEFDNRNTKGLDT